MRIISFLIMLSLSFNVLAQSGSIHALEKSIDEYQYALSVEWDQKDSSFHDQQTDIFLKKMDALIQEEGLEKEQVRALAKSKIKDEAAYKALELKMGLLSGANSSKELIELLKENSKEFYSKGASWNGEVFFENAIIVAVVIAVAYSVYFHSTHKCASYEYLGYDECEYEVIGQTYDGAYVYSNYQTCEEAKRCSEYVKR